MWQIPRPHLTGTLKSLTQQINVWWHQQMNFTFFIYCEQTSRGQRHISHNMLNTPGMYPPSAYLWPYNVGVPPGANRRVQHDSSCEVRHECQCAALRSGKTWTCSAPRSREMVRLRSRLKMWEDEAGRQRVAGRWVIHMTSPSQRDRRKTLLWFGKWGCQIKACVLFINFMSDAKNVNFFHAPSLCRVLMTCDIVALFLSEICCPCSCWQKVLQGSAGILKKACKTNK